MTTLKVGIIGLGGIARSHCDAIATLDNVEVVAVADLFEEKRRQYMEEYGIPRGYPSHTELLEGRRNRRRRRRARPSPASPPHRRRL